MAEIFQNVVLHLCLAVLAVIAAACAFVGLYRVGAWLRANLCPVSLAVFSLAAVVATCEAQKRSVSVGSGGITTDVPVAVTNADWLAHGAYEDWFYILPSNWWARAASGGWIGSLRVFSFGGFQAYGAGGTWSGSPPPFPQKLSLAPLANWHLLTNHEALATRHESLFWHGVTGSNTLVMTWQDGLYARCATNLVSFQAELFNDGSVAYRYDGSPVATNDFVVPLELPFDRDGDGLENSVDPEPDVAGPDAHGTNAEWYNTVCSNVLTAVATSCDPPVELSWLEGVNSNAYYLVDIVAEKGPAPIYFTGDRASRLGDPVVVARAGETSRVPLLIGVEYAVTSDTPFSVSFPADYMYPEVVTNEPCVARIHWPLVFMVSGTPSAYVVETVPPDLNGTFEWGEAGGGTGTPPMRSASCGYTANGGSVSYNCIDCECHGCSVSGSYTYERAAFALPILRCGCTGDGEPEDQPTPTPHFGPEGNPSVSVSFGKAAVIFEDQYENTPGSWVERNSSSAMLTITAYGGVNGATLSAIGTGLSRLEHADGNAFPNSPVSVPPGCDVTYGIVYEGLEASDGANDITVNASVTDGMTGATRTDSAAITSIRVELVAEKVAPGAPTCVNRHVYGVLEKVLRRTYPSGLALTWPVFPDLDYNYDTDDHFYCPLKENNVTMIATYGDAELPIQIVVERPHVVCTGAEWRGEKGAIGDAGCVAMCLFYYVSPRTVSFEGLHMEEVPVTDTPPAGAIIGYFSSVQTPLHATHDTSMGAGVWWPVSTNAYWRMDTVRAPLFPHPWSAGTLRWKIPMAWGYPYAGDDEKLRQYVLPNPAAEQIYTMGDWGTVTIQKSGHTIERNIINGIWLDGNQVN